MRPSRACSTLGGMGRHRWDPIARPADVVRPGRVGVDLTPDQARGSRWVQTSPRFYVPAGTEQSVEQRLVETAMRLPPYAALTGWAGLRLAGVAWCDGLAPDGVTPLPVPVVVGTRGGIRRDDRITVSFERLPSWEVWAGRGVPVTRPERALFDEMRGRSSREALVVLESALAARVTSLRRFAAYVAAHPSARRRDRVQWALPRARGGVRSPLEVRVRTLAEEDAGLPRLLVNRVVLDERGRRIGEVDLLDEEAGMVLEIDGADHRDAETQIRDITKEDALRRAGLEVARVTGRQARRRDELVERVTSTRGRCLFSPPDRRRWSLQPIDDRDLALEAELELAEWQEAWDADWEDSLGLWRPSA